jgi:hypothetical protein
MPATLGYRMVEASIDKQTAASRNSGPVKREIDYLKTAIAKVTSADDLVKNYRLFRVVLSAYGLDSQIDATLARLLAAGHDRDRAIAMIGMAMMIELNEVMRNERPFDRAGLAAPGIHAGTAEPDRARQRAVGCNRGSVTAAVEVSG